MLATVRPNTRDVSLFTPEPAYTTESRYAIYFVPSESSAWWRFGTSWLGRDIITGKSVGQDNATTTGLDDDYRDRITCEPRRYGLHATLKAPVHLAPGYAPHDLYRQTAHLAATQVPITLTPLELSVIDGFVALTLAHDPVRNAAVAMLANQCVAAIDNLRERASAGEIARHHKQGLTPRQATLLLQWGYPYVFEDFRFHVTLTGRLPLPEQARILEVLGPAIQELNQEALVLNNLAVCLQPRRHAPFVLVRRYGFDGSTRCYFHDN